MFRSARKIDEDATKAKLERLRTAWVDTRDTWFDGSVESVERRLARLDEVTALSKRAGAAGQVTLAALPQLRKDRDDLVALRRQLTGADWFGGGDEEAAQHNLDPRNYPNREEWMNANNLRGYIEHAHQDYPVAGWDYGAGDHAVPSLGDCMTGRDRIMGLRHAAREFIDDQNTSDRSELLVRARRLMAAKTSGWGVQAAQEATEAFLGAVAAQAPTPRPRTAGRVGPSVMNDFDDHLMFS